MGDKLLCLFPLPQIPEQVQEVPLQAKIEEGKSRMKEKEKKIPETMTKIKQNKNSFNIQPQVL